MHSIGENSSKVSGEVRSSFAPPEADDQSLSSDLPEEEIERFPPALLYQQDAGGFAVEEGSTY